jgi:hypothetical protein
MSNSNNSAIDDDFGLERNNDVNLNLKRCKIDVKKYNPNNNNWNAFSCPVFDVNHLAFQIWQYFTLYQLLWYCQIHRSWQTRIWPFFDEGQQTKALAKSLITNTLKRKAGWKRMKKHDVLEKVDSMQLDSKSCVITSSLTHYLYRQKSLNLSKKLPIQSRLIALFSFAVALKHLTLKKVAIKSKFNPGIKNMSLIAECCPNLLTLNLIRCNITADLWKPILRMTSLIQLSVFNGEKAYCRFPHFYHQTSLPRLKHFAFDAVLTEHHENYLDKYFDPKSIVQAFVDNRDVVFKFSSSVVFLCLTHLTIVGKFYSITDGFCPENFPALTSFTLETNSYTVKEMMEKVSEFTKLTHLTVVNTPKYNSNGGTDIGSWLMLQKLTFLTHLCVVNMQYFEDLMYIIHNTNLDYRLKSLKISAFHVSRQSGSIAQLETFLHELKVYGTNLSEFEMNQYDMFHRMKHFNLSSPQHDFPLCITNPLHEERFLQYDQLYEDICTWKSSDLEN